jgi:hypothetical protein
MRAGRVVVTMAAVLAAALARAEPPDAATRVRVSAEVGVGAGVALPARTMLAGRLVSVDARSGYITIYRDHRVLKVDLARAPLVTLGGRDVALTDLQPGQSVVVQLTEVGRTAKANWVVAKPGPMPQGPAVAASPAVPVASPARSATLATAQGRGER